MVMKLSRMKLQLMAEQAQFWKCRSPAKAMRKRLVSSPKRWHSRMAKQRRNRRHGKASQGILTFIFEHKNQAQAVFSNNL